VHHATPALAAHGLLAPQTLTCALRSVPAFSQGLLQLLRNLKKDDSELRMLMLGLDNSGKTTALKQLAGVRLRRTTNAAFDSAHLFRCVNRAEAFRVAVRVRRRTHRTSRRPRASTSNRSRAQGSSSTCGTLAGRSIFGRTGRTTTRTPMRSCTWSTPPTSGARLPAAPVGIASCAQAPSAAAAAAAPPSPALPPLPGRGFRAPPHSDVRGTLPCPCARALCSRTDEAAEELQALLDEELLAGIPLLVFANKQDLLNAMTAGELMKELELTNDKSRWTHVQACSAKTGDGLNEGLEQLLKQVKGASS
jgi:GTPase SAR1 family protein